MGNLHESVYLKPFLGKLVEMTEDKIIKPMEQ